MEDLRLIEAIKNKDYAAVEALLQSGINIHQQDEYGWTGLNWVAGSGDIALARRLLELGANVLNTGRDLRTPYKIALAAGHAEMARLLSDAEKKAGLQTGEGSRSSYCKAYLLHELRRFDGWSESRKNSNSAYRSDSDDSQKALADEDVVFIHKDFSVTRSIWHGDDVIFDQVTQEWKEFCSGVLGFSVPDDLSMIVSATAVAEFEASLGG
jgi:hypothetical protein